MSVVRTWGLGMAHLEKPEDPKMWVKGGEPRKVPRSAASEASVLLRRPPSS